jgi:glycosyltransferase involved in cell wall biosynthesis
METVAWELAVAFAKKGMHITILTTAISGRTRDFEDSGVRILATPGTSWRGYGRRWWRESRNTFEQELLGRCNLVLSVSAAGYGLLPLRPQVPNLPFVLQAHGTSLGEAISKWRSGSPKAIATSIRNATWIAKDIAAYPQFDAVVPVGDRVAADLASWPLSRALDHRHVHLIQNGINTEQFRPDAGARARARSELGWDGDSEIVISVSRLHRQKGVHLGLHALATLMRQRPRVRYLIVGDGPEQDALKASAKNLGIEGRVKFSGGVSRGAVPIYLNAADVFLFTTTRVEGAPLNLLEAMAVGLPVVASRHLYQGDPESYAQFVDPHDAVAVAAALHRALDVKPPGTSLLPSRLSLDTSVNTYLRLFDDLIAQRRQ